jgi:hypothetical protein
MQPLSSDRVVRMSVINLLGQFYRVHRISFLLQGGLKEHSQLWGRQGFVKPRVERLL